MQIPVLLFSIIFHEFAHGFVAHRNGDDTAYLSGRLTLNPIPHIDPIGTVLLPAIAMLTRVPMIGWAKPVPVNPYRLNDPRRDMVKVALSGPFSNVILIVFSALAYKVLTFGILPPDIAITLLKVLSYAIMINVALAVFNLLPVFPLDGSQIALNLLKGRALEVYEKHLPYGFYILIGLLLLGVFGFFFRFALWITALFLYKTLGIIII